MRPLLKILLLIFKFLLRIARIFNFKKLESFIEGFLKRNDFKETEIKPTLKFKGGVSESRKPTIKKLTIKRDEPKDENTEQKEREVTLSRYDTDTDKEEGFNATPLLVTAGVVAAGVGIASIVRNRNEKPKEGDLGDAEFAPDETYDEIFMKGFKKVTGMDYQTAPSGKSSLSDFFSKGFKSGAKSGNDFSYSNFFGTKREWAERPQKYKQHYQSNRVGQSMDFMKGYSYNQRGQAIENRRINEIIIHCTATPEGREVSLQELYNWHKARNFIDIGYHFVVHIDGTIESARPLNIMGAHCEGHNAHSIGISYVGGTRRDDPQKPKDTRTEAQRAQIWNLVYYLLRYFPSATIHGHNEYAAKACPCFNVRQEWKELQMGVRSGGYASVGGVKTQTFTSTQFNDDKNVQKGDRKIVKGNG